MISHRQSVQRQVIEHSSIITDIHQMSNARTTTETDKPGDALLRSLRILLQQIVNRKRNCDQYFTQSQRALGALPLTTSEYGQVFSSIQNVKTYLARDEAGAAKYELGLLLRRLPRVLDKI